MHPLTGWEQCYCRNNHKGSKPVLVNNHKPVSYISHSMTIAEQRYSLIEKESVVLTWACKRFTDYLLGLKDDEV